MKKKILIIGGAILFVVILIVAALLGKGEPKKDKNTSKKDDFVYMGVYEREVIDRYNDVFTNYNDYNKAFNSDKLTKKDFENNNYVVVSIMYDSCSEYDITPTNYKVNGNDIEVEVKYKGKCGGCAPEYMYYLLKVDKSVTNVNVMVDSTMTNNPECDPNVSYKPLIYLYPEKEMDVEVKLGNPELLTTTYPEYIDGWKVTAKPNGDLIDKSGRTYYGLYWEGNNNIKDSYEDGFVVEKENIVSFLEEKLAILGLNEREANEFIIYWKPILEQNEYNLIRFADIDVINEQMPLSINPTPDSVIRVLMIYKPIDKRIDIKEQKLKSFNRIGFTVVEWGGSLVR